MEVEVDVHLDVHLLACLDNPELCTHGEAEGSGSQPCWDRVDNDDDGAVDAADPDCQGIATWNVAVATDDCFHLHEVTPHRDSRRRNFERTEIINPNFNDGQQGIVSTVELSYLRSLTLPHGSSVQLFTLSGQIETDALRETGDRTPPCGVQVLPGTRLFGSAQAVGTRIGQVPDEFWQPMTVATSGASVELLLTSADAFLRGDADANGRADISDAVFLLNSLFLAGPSLPCRDAADTDDTGELDLSDGVALLNFLFLAGTMPGRPGLEACGGDPTDDGLDCAAYDACPAVVPTTCDVPPIEDSPICSRTYLEGAGESIALVDLDLDGNLDLVGASWGSPGVSVNLGCGDGTFEFLDVGFAGPFDTLAVGDLDNDGAPDLVAAQGGFTPFLNLGDGDLLPVPAVAAALNIRVVVVADFDGDGSDDVAAATDDGAVVTFLNLGDGTFFEGEAHLFAERATFPSLLAGDLDGDGATDLLVSYFPGSSDAAGNVWILLNRGDGGFEEPARLSAGLGPHAMAVGDFTGDGILDLSVTHFLGKSDGLSMFPGNGDGTFSRARKRQIGNERGGCGGGCGDPQGSLMTDFDGDGNLDIVTRKVFNSELIIMHGDGDGAFGRVLRHHPGSGVKALAAGDLDGDGDNDLVASQGRGGVAVVMVNCSR